VPSNCTTTVSHAMRRRSAVVEGPGSESTITVTGSP
jgi:hypothetical protein